MRLCEGRGGGGGAGRRGRAVPGRAPQVSAAGRGAARLSHRLGRPGEQRTAELGAACWDRPARPARGFGPAEWSVGLSARRVSAASSSPSRPVGNKRRRFPVLLSRYVITSPQ